MVFGSWFVDSEWNRTQPAFRFPLFSSPSPSPQPLASALQPPGYNCETKPRSEFTLRWASLFLRLNSKAAWYEAIALFVLP